MIELSLEDLGKICGGSSGEEYDRTRICGFCGNPASRVEACDIRGNGCTPMYYCESCWMHRYRDERRCIKIQHKEAKRHKRNR